MRSSWRAVATITACLAIGFAAGRWMSGARGKLDTVPTPAECGPAPSRAAPERSPPGAVQASASTGASTGATSSAASAGASAPPGPRAPARSEPAQPGAAAQADDWEQVPLDLALGETLGSFTTRKAVSAGIHAFSRPAFASCFKAYVPPIKVDKYQLQVELRLVGREQDFLIEDARALEASYGDERLERCIPGVYKGRVIDVPPEMARRHRLRWATVKYFQ